MSSAKRERKGASEARVSETREQKLTEASAWIAQTCVMFGASPETAHEVAAIFAKGIRREWAKRRGASPSPGYPDERGD